MWLPSIRTGLNYSKHEGVIQDVGGRVFDTGRTSANGGLGVAAIGAGSPGICTIAPEVRDDRFQVQLRSGSSASSLPR